MRLNPASEEESLSRKLIEEIQSARFEARPSSRKN